MKKNLLLLLSIATIILVIFSGLVYAGPSKFRDATLATGETELNKAR